MASPTTYQNLLFVQNGTQSVTLDASQAGTSVPRRVADYHGYSFQVVWTGSPQGTLAVQQSNAPVMLDQLVAPANWVTIPALTLSIGQGSTPASSPSLLEVTFGRAGWVSLLWTPAAGSGAITVNFDGVRR